MNALHYSSEIESLLGINENLNYKKDARLRLATQQSCRGIPRRRGYTAEKLASLVGFLLLLVAITFPSKHHNIQQDPSGTTVQVGLLLWFGLCFIMAEILRRVCLFSEEIYHLRTRYEASWSRLVLHVFNFRNSANFVTVLILLALLIISSLDPMVMTEIGYHWPSSFGVVGIYLIFIAVIKLTENLVDCEILLDEHVMAIGQGLAYSYYYGFLKIILPATENNPNLRERATHFEYEEKIKLASKKMLILIPDSCFCTPIFQDMGNDNQRIERVKNLADVHVSRAGMKGRPYSAQVYLIQTDEMQDPEYVIMEMPSILYVLYEMNTIGENHSRLTSFERTQQAQAFFRTLSRLLENDPSCKDLYDIIYYKDQNVKLAEMIKNHISKTKKVNLE